jgi:hypothetical protein
MPRPQSVLLPFDTPRRRLVLSRIIRQQQYTCQDDLYVECRFVVDYRFGFVYMTFGHYRRASFALLIRSSAELYFEVMPTLPALKVNYAQ